MTDQISKDVKSRNSSVDSYCLQLTYYKFNIFANQTDEAQQRNLTQLSKIITDLNIEFIGLDEEVDFELKPYTKITY